MAEAGEEAAADAADDSEDADPNQSTSGDTSRINRTVTWNDCDFRDCIRYESDDDT